MKILVTGGAGYIGSHTCVELLSAGCEVIIVDNLCNSKQEAVNRIEEISGRTVTFYQTDLTDKEALETVFLETHPDAVIHFAGLKAVAVSVSLPLDYYRNNLISTINLLDLMKKYGVRSLIFSSSATVYGMSKTVPITEDFPLSAANPYGSTKLMIEKILTDFQQAEADFSIVILRYFNPIGAHESGRIGEDPSGIPNNLIPYVTQVAIGRHPYVHVNGSDYPTPDGTGVRDYIHVVDLARGHIKALDKKSNVPGLYIYNLGTGRGSSVLDIIAAFSRACQKELPYQFEARRPGDAAQSYADASKAERELGWKAEYGLDRMCADSWRWQSQNPEGF